MGIHCMRRMLIRASGRRLQGAGHRRARDYKSKDGGGVCYMYKGRRLIGIESGGRDGAFVKVVICHEVVNRKRLRKVRERGE
jgi:hypothetical protein